MFNVVTNDRGIDICRPHQATDSLRSPILKYGDRSTIPARLRLASL